MTPRAIALRCGHHDAESVTRGPGRRSKTMTPAHANSIQSDETSDDYQEAVAAEADGRCTISAGTIRGTVSVYWHAAPASSAPGGPAVQVRVRA